MKSKQLKLDIYKGKWGGRRPGSGRKRIHSQGVAHRTRETVCNRNPLHVNFRFRTTIRRKQNLKILKRAIFNARSHGLRIIHFSMQSNHIHLIIEASSNEVLTRGMRSLTVTFAKRLKMGKIQVERYHLHVLKTLRETRNAVLYVLFNKQNHEKGRYSVIDEYSSVTSLPNASLLLRKFSKKNKVTLRVGGRADFEPDTVISYLLKNCFIKSYFSDRKYPPHGEALHPS